MLEYYGAARRFKYLPPTTEETIIIPFNAFTFEFDTTVYNPSLTDHRLANKELKRFLSGINHILQEHKKKIYQDNNLRNTCAFLLLLIVGAITNAVLIPATGKIELLGVGLGIIFLGMVFWLINLIKQARRAKRIRGEARKATLDYIQSKKEIFDEKGLRWEIPERFPNWIELWKDYVNDGNKSVGGVESEHSIYGSEPTQTAVKSRPSTIQKKKSMDESAIILNSSGQYTTFDLNQSEIENA